MIEEYKYTIKYDRIIIVRKSDGKPIGQWKPKDDLSEAMDEEKHRHNDNPNNGFVEVFTMAVNIDKEELFKTKEDQDVI